MGNISLTEESEIILSDFLRLLPLLKIDKSVPELALQQRLLKAVRKQKFAGLSRLATV